MENQDVVVRDVNSTAPAVNLTPHLHKESATEVYVKAEVLGNKLSFFAKRQAVIDKDVIPQSSCCPWLCGQ